MLPILVLIAALAFDIAIPVPHSTQSLDVSPKHHIHFLVIVEKLKWAKTFFFYLSYMRARDAEATLLSAVQLIRTTYVAQLHRDLLHETSIDTAEEQLNLRSDAIEQALLSVCTWVPLDVMRWKAESTMYKYSHFDDGNKPNVTLSYRRSRFARGDISKFHELSDALKAYPMTTEELASASDAFILELIGDDRSVLVSRFVNALTSIISHAPPPAPPPPPAPAPATPTPTPTPTMAPAASTDNNNNVNNNVNNNTPMPDHTHRPTPAEHADTFLRTVIQMLEDQTRTNPPRFVSHGTDHSVRVMEIAVSLLDHIPEASLAVTSLYTRLHAEFLLAFVGLVHDIGYTIAPDDQPKWIHAPLGRLMLEGLINTDAWNMVINELRRGTSELAVVQEAILDAVETHNYDRQECITVPIPKDCQADFDHKHMERVFDLVELDTEPLDFILRVADNLDASRIRLTLDQRDPDFIRYLLRLYQDAPLRRAVRATAAIRDTGSFKVPSEIPELGHAQQRNISPRDLILEQARADARARALAQIDALHAKANASDSMRSLVDNANEQSFLHFYSNWIIDRHRLRKLDTGRFLLEIFFYNVDSTVPELAFRLHPGAALYQMNRMAQAVAAVKIGGMQFLEVTDVKLRNVGKETDPVYHRRHRLHSFTTAPIYTPEGQSESEFCGSADSVDCIATLYLTLSEELCLEPNGTQVTCAIAVTDSLTVPPLPPVPSASILSSSVDYEYWVFDLRETPTTAAITQHSASAFRLEWSANLILATLLAAFFIALLVLLGISTVSSTISLFNLQWRTRTNHTEQPTVAEP
jgi:hypothetical protein